MKHQFVTKLELLNVKANTMTIMDVHTIENQLMIPKTKMKSFIA